MSTIDISQRQTNRFETRRKRIFLSPPHMSGDETAFIRQAFKSNYIAPAGPMVDAFEREFSKATGLRHAAAVSSGTAAMHLAMNLIDVRPGDEVFASSLTFIGSVTPIIFQGAVPVFIDSNFTSWNMNPELLRRELERSAKRGKLPKAVVPTDIYGQCADLDAILEVCAPCGVPVVVDAAEALGASYKGRGAGVGARAAIFSFNGNKILTTSGGGMIASDDQELIGRARFLSEQAKDPAPHYEHSTIGYNYRMSNILAALGRGQLKSLEARIARKRKIFEYYSQALGDLPGITFMPEAAYGRCTRWLTVILIEKEAFGAASDDVRLALETQNIESRPVWKPMHLQPVFKIEGQPARSRCGGGNPWPARTVGGSVSEYLFANGLCLPSGTSIKESELARVAAIISKTCKNK